MNKRGICLGFTLFLLAAAAYAMPVYETGAQKPEEPPLAEPAPASPEQAAAETASARIDAAAGRAEAAAGRSETGAAQAETASTRADTAADRSESGAAQAETASARADTAADRSESGAARAETAAGRAEDAAKRAEDAAGRIAQAPQKAPERPAAEHLVEVVKDSEGGWQLLVEDEPFFVKGMVWSTNPPGSNFNFSLWRESEATIKTLIDRDGAMMREMGVNAVRSFADIPPKWVEYLYDRYGIYTIINDLFGRYGTTVGGRWYAVTDYADPAVRAVVIKNALAAVEKYKDVRGVLLYLFGNENNYGLAWGAGNTIHELDYDGGNVTERRARALYTAFEEAMREAKEIDPDHPVGLVNGDVGWMNIISEVCVSMDVIGLNMYRGERAGAEFYQRVKESIDKPIVYSEIGADAWNAKLMREDQYNQSKYISSQWKEIYENSYGRGSANALGGCVFEWTDEWWKHNPDSQANLDVHDTDPDWGNSGFASDFVPGRANMNEEWFGVTSQGPAFIGRFTVKHPRAAYYALQYIWSLDPAAVVGEGVESHFSGLNLGLTLARGTADAAEDHPRWKLSNSFSFASLHSGDDVWKNLKDLDGKEKFTGLTGLFPEHNWAAKLETTFWGKTNETPWGRLEGSATVAVRHDLVYGEPLSSKIEETVDQLNPDRAIDLYSGYFKWTAERAEVNGYYHSGHTDWIAEGDFFNFLPETYDLEEYDRWGSKAPVAVEGIYRFGLPGRQGLAVIAGPEPFAGAQPQIIGKWYQTIGAFSFSGFFSQETGGYDDPDLGDDDPGTVQSGAAKASLWLAWKPQMSGESSLLIDFGVLGANWQKIDAKFKTNDDREGTLGFADTLGLKARVAYSPVSFFSAQLEGVYAGVAADTNAGTARVGTLLTDIGKGNRYEIKGGVTGNYGNFSLQLNGLWRKPVVGPITHPLLAGYSQANPFQVGANREAFTLEAVFSYDDEPGSWIWAWNGDDTEGAFIAASLVARYSIYEGPTDPGSYVGAEGLRYYFARGLPEARGTAALELRTVFNPIADLRLTNTAELTRGQPNSGMAADDSRELITGFQDELKVRYKRLIFGGLAAFDLWGPETWDRDFNLTYPLRWGFELAWSFKPEPSLVNSTERAGLRWNGVFRDRYSPNFTSRDSQEIELFFNVRF